MFVAAQQQGRVEVFDSTGTYQTQFGTFGSGYEQLRNPQGVAVAPGAYVYVTDEWNDTMVQFDITGTPVYELGSGTAGTGDGQFSGPVGIAVDPSTYHLYIADTLNDRVEAFG